jgi:hypothetical protein
VRRLFAVASIAVLVGGCGGHSSERRPDVEGVVTAVDVHQVTVDGTSYPVSPRLRSFAAGTGQTVPLLWRAGQYVQVGLKRHTAVWIEGIGAVVRVEGHPPAVYFTQVLRRVSGGKAVFADGTILRLGSTRPPAHLPVRVQVEIDPAAHAIRRFF